MIKRQKMTYNTRNNLRSNSLDPYQKVNHFVPALAIRRPVILEDNEVDSIKRKLKRSLKQLPRRQAKHCQVIPPESWSVTVVEQAKLIRELKSLEIPPSSQDMWRLAGLLRQLMLKKIVQMPQHIEMPLGKTELFGHASPKQYIGISPLGWRGPRARYFRNEQNNEIDVLGALVNENEICVQAIANSFPLDEDLAFDGLTNSPHLSLIRNPNGFRDHQFRMISDAISEALPASLNLGDPVIFLQAERGNIQKVNLRQ